MTRRLPLLVLGTVLCGTAAHAQGYPVAGRIVDAVTHDPVARATVTLVPVQQAPGPRPVRGAPPSSLTTVTGPDGAFGFPAVAPGRYELSAARRGYITAKLDQHGDYFAAAVIGPGLSTTDISFPLDPGATIEGAVSDSSGDPVEQGTVTLFRQADDGTGAIEPLHSARLSEGDRSYAFSDLTPGTYYLGVTSFPWFAQSIPGMQAPLDVAYAPLFYPGADSAANAQAIALAPGDDIHADMTLQAVPAVHLQFASRPGGGFIPRFSVEAFGGSINAMVSADVQFHDGHSTATVSVAPGTYSISSAQGRQSVTIAQGISLDAPPAIADVPVTGQLALDNSQALPPGLELALTRLHDGAPRRSFRFGRGGGTQLHMHFHTRPTTVPLRPDGRFQTQLRPGDYTLGLEGAPGAALAITGAAATGGTLTDGTTLHVESAPVMLAATLDLARSAVSGQVIDAQGAPEAGVLVLLVPAQSGTVLLPRADESNTNGAWEIAGVPSGAYRVVVIADGWDLDWQQPAALAKYLPGGLRVTLPPAASLALPRPLTAQPR